MNDREKAFSTVPTITEADIARELGVTEAFVQEEVRAGRLVRNKDGQFTGLAFSDYLIQRRRESR